MISNCGHDENEKYSGGAAGDQTGAEWEIRTWYNRPWNCVLRHPDRNVGNMLADLARKAAQNNLVGYDQNQRGTYWQHLKASNYDPAQITIKCEADCSSGVAANVKATGYRLGIKALQNVSADCYTGNLRAALKAAGFEVLTDSKYLTSDAYLLPGDILLYEGHHTATNLDTGSKAGSSTPGTPVSGDTYTVRSGDTLSEIAAAWGVSVSDLAAYNGISDPNVITVGQVIKNPAKNHDSGSWQATGTATCSGNDVNVRSGPGTGYAPYGQLDRGNRFEVDGQKSGSWVRVKAVVNGQERIGWMSEQYVTYDTASQAQSKPSTGWQATGTATCTGNGVRVRSTPDSSRSDNILGSLGVGNRFEIDGQTQNGFHHIKVSLNGKSVIGWISSQYVKKD